MIKLLLRCGLYPLMVVLFLAACTKIQATPNPSLGLSRYAADQVEIWLPNDFYLVDTEVDLEEFRQFMTEIDPANSAYWTQPGNTALKPILELYAVRDTSQFPYHDAVTVYALYHSIPPVPPPAPADVAKGLTYYLPDSLHAFGYKELSLPAGEAAHTSLELQMEQFPVSSDIYALTSKSSLWLITFTGDSETFAADIRDYRTWIETFQVIGSPSVIDYYRHNSQIFNCCGSLLLVILIIVIAIKVRSSRGPIYEPG
jgi:hypothetical protein